jgi:hydroxyethylthiazole kinase-like uncharacterized protein yjeF
MKIFNVDSVRKADAYTIKHEPITSIDLMERAASACVDFIRNNFVDANSMIVVAGPGNNGGDGLAIARQLCEDIHEIHVFIPDLNIPRSEDFKINLDRLEKLESIVIHLVKEDKDLKDLPKADLLVDALFGSGLNRPVKGLLGKMIDACNAHPAPVLSIDIPSGMFADIPLEKGKGSVIQAQWTLSLELPKLMMLMPEAASHVGELHLIPIGLHPDFVVEEPASAIMLDEQIVTFLHRKRPKFAHKGWAGHGLLLAGSADKPGAAVLAAGGGLRSGIGLLTVHGPQAVGAAILQHYPEAMLSHDSDEKVICQLPDLQKYDAIAIGPGLGMQSTSAAVLKLLIQNASQPLVLDADALNILSDNTTWLGFLAPQTILTPHPGEFDRLVGPSENHYERIQKLQALSKKHQLFIVLKGAHSCISCPDGTLYFNNTGNPGMASGGSGDVLTGILLGLLAQGYSPHDATLLGVWLHGLAADLALEHQSVESLIARDIIENLGSAYKTLSR